MILAGISLVPQRHLLSLPESVVKFVLNIHSAHLGIIIQRLNCQHLILSFFLLGCMKDAHSKELRRRIGTAVICFFKDALSTAHDQIDAL